MAVRWCVWVCPTDSVVVWSDLCVEAGEADIGWSEERDWTSSLGVDADDLQWAIHEYRYSKWYIVTKLSPNALCLAWWVDAAGIVLRGEDAVISA